jgi:carboxyl-terminal processing protease
MRFFKMPSKNFFLALASVAVVALLGGSSYYIGYRNGVNNPETIVVKGISNIEDPDVRADFGIFWEARKKLKALHIDGETLDDLDVLYGAISGMTGVLKDPNTVFLRPDDSKKFEEDISGSFGGIGAEIGIKDEQLIIVAPLKESPAERIGLKSGDEILKIDDFNTAGVAVVDAVKKIRGPNGTPVTLEIYRKGWDDSKQFKIIRDTIVIPNLEWEIKDGGIIHVRLYNFNENAPASFYEAAIGALLNNAQGMILDLRNNPGGFLEVAINLSGWFFNKGDIVVSEHFRQGPDRVFRANGNGVFKNMPVVVLINQGSASASEILAGALRDLRGAKLVGEKSFGKGTVQELQGLRDGSKLKITIANWLLPSGQAIEKAGLVPDYEVKPTEADVKAERDTQYEKAVEVLKAEIAKSKKGLVTIGTD